MIKKSYVKAKQLYKVTFEVPAAQFGESRDIRILSSFNDWSWDGGLVMKNSKGTYTASTELPAGHYQFRYLADGWDWKNDDSAEAYTDSGYGTINCCFALEAVAAKKADAKPAAVKAEAKPAVKKAAAKPAAKKVEAKPAAIKAEAKPAAKKAEAKPAVKAAAKPAAKKAAPKKK